MNKKLLALLAVAAVGVSVAGATPQTQFNKGEFQVDLGAANVETKTNSINIDNIERKIAREEAMANGLGELKNLDNFDSEFEELGDVDLDAELEKYKSGL
ncbi:MAG: hypothetical protein E6765_02995 [Enterococcus faecalis]|nr:hypothetical protein [Enterococcus faecalis]